MSQISLRSFLKDDIEIYRAWVNNPIIGKMVGRDELVTKKEHERWYYNLIDNINARVFAIEVDSQYIGNVWLWNIEKQHKKAEVRILMGLEHGKGYGTQALNQIAGLAFGKLNLNRLYAYVFDYNKRALCAFARAGFMVEGLLKSDRIINGEYVDAYIIARLK